MLKLLDLFSGIGGFSLAARWTGAIQTVAFCEIDPFCQKVLKKHWPTVPIISDIREVTGERIRGVVENTGCEHGTRAEVGRKPEGPISCQKDASLSERSTGDGGKGFVDILTGGFPCQPFSCAGKRKGTADNRFLWPEMLRVIREVKPTWVIAENVRGLLSIDNGVVFEDCCASLEAEGYAVQPFVIPACAVNAPHRRDRVWIVAKSNGGRKPQSGVQQTGVFAESDRNAPDTLCYGCYGEQTEVGGKHPEGIDGAQAGENPMVNNSGLCGVGGEAEDAPDTGNEGLQGGEVAGSNGIDGAQSYDKFNRGCTGWDEPWIEVATRLCRVDDGLPRRMDRVNRLKALGNAIVPQVAHEILKTITEINND
jgi:DNA (cytosine-5)-methyltransferase 1